MPDVSHPSPLSRRTFLKAAALGGAALVSAQLFGAPAQLLGTPAPQRPARSSAPLRVGVLLPQPTVYPALGENFLAGLQIALAGLGGAIAGRPVQLQPAGFGVSPGAALAMTRQLIEQRAADLIVTTVSSGVASSLHGLLAEHETPLIVSSPGANITRHDRESPYLVRNMLGYWQSSFALGAWAARSLGASAVIATSFYDSGYDANYAFRIGFERMGGAIVDTHVTHLPARSTDLVELCRAIDAARPDLVYAAYCGREAVEFVRAYAEAGLAGRVPLLGSGFLTDESILPEQGPAAQGIRTALAWAPSLDTPANASLATAFAERAGRPADAFAALGYDTATLLAQGLDAVDGRVEQTDRLLDALGRATFDGPRGRVTMDPATRSAVSPIYLREVRSTPRGLANAVLAELPHPADDERLAAVRTSVLSGWQNAYLSI